MTLFYVDRGRRQTGPQALAARRRPAEGARRRSSTRRRTNSSGSTWPDRGTTSTCFTRSDELHQRRTALPRRRHAGWRVEDDPAARGRARVHRRPPRRPILHPHQQRGDELPHRHLSGGQHRPRRLDRLRRRTTRPFTSRGCRCSATSRCSASGKTPISTCGVIDLRSGLGAPDRVRRAGLRRRPSARTRSSTRRRCGSVTRPRSRRRRSTITTWRAAPASCSSGTEVPGGYDPSAYQTERIHATAPDGTRVPISLVYKKGLKRDGIGGVPALRLRLLRHPASTGFDSIRLQPA